MKLVSETVEAKYLYTPHRQVEERLLVARCAMRLDNLKNKCIIKSENH